MTNPWAGLRGLPRQAWTLCFATLVNRTGTMVLPFLALYLTRELGISARDAGGALAVYGVGSLVTTPVAGRLCDRVGALRILRASLVLSGLVLLFVPFVHGLGPVLAATFLWSVASEAARPASFALLSHVVAPEQRKPAFALLRLAVNLGMSIGPAVGGLLATVSFPALFWVDGATSIAAGLVLAVAHWDVRTEPASGRTVAGDVIDPGSGAVGAGGERRTVTEVLPGGGGGAGVGAAAAGREWRFGGFSDGRLLYFLLALTPVQLVFFQCIGAMPVHLVRHQGMPETLYGILFTINTILIILIEVPLNTAMAHWPHRLALPLGSVLYALGFGALGYVSGFPAVAATVVVWTFGEMILMPGSATYVAEISPEARRGEYMGLYAMSFSLAFALGPWLGTNALESLGPRALWSGSFGFACLSALLMARLRSPAPAPGAARS